MFWQRDAVRSTLHAMQDILKAEVRSSTTLTSNVYPALCQTLETLSEESNWQGGLVQTDHFSCSFGGGVTHQTQLMEQIEQVQQTGKTSLSLFGVAWGVLMPTKKFAAVVQPILDDNGSVGVACIFAPLEPVYKGLRSDLRVILACLVVNTLVLTFIGFSRFYYLTVKPIQRLIQVADSYEESGLPFLTHESGGEYRQLHASLNQMLERISADKHRLEQSVASLEKANAQILATRQEMIQAEKLSSIGRLSSGLAHEIGNPIGIVQGYLELLKGECPEQDKDEFIKRSEQELARIGTLLRQLLDYSRPALAAPEQVSAHEVLTSVSELLRPQPLMTDINLVCSLGAENDIVEGSRDQLQQIFINALINAADAIHGQHEAGKGEITILTHAVQEGKQPFLQIKIIDNGSGVADSDLQHVFDPFFTTKEPGKGTGLGLSVSYSHVESMGGKMHMSNNEEGGITLHISFPLIGT